MRMNAMKKSITAILSLCLLFALETSLRPLPAAPARNETPAADKDDFQAGLIEVESGGTGAVQGKKSLLLPIIAAVTAAGAIAAVLVLVVFKKTYDITGNWRLTIEYDGHPTGYNFAFSGTKKSGTFNIILPGYVLGSGTYEVDGKDVSITIDWNGPDVANLTGAFTDADHMEGTYTETPDYSGRWYAERVDIGAAELKEQAASDRHARR